MPAKPAKGRVRTRALETSDGLDFMRQAANVEDVAHEMVMHIIKLGADVLYGHYIDEQSNAQTATDTIENVINTVEFQLAPHDEGELLAHMSRESWNIVDEEVQNLTLSARGEGAADAKPPAVGNGVNPPQLWTCEAEPLPCEIDRWASGVVPVLSRSVSPRYQNLTNFNRSPSLNSRGVDQDMESNAGSTYSRRTATKSLYGGSRTSMGRSLKSSENVLQEVEKKKPTRIFVAKTKHEGELEKIRAYELSRMEKKRKANERRKAQRLRQEEEEKRYEALKKDLRGKNYTFDEKGNVIVINALNGDRMPTVAFGPKVKIASETDKSGEKSSTSSLYSRPKKDGALSARQAEDKAIKAANHVEQAVVQPPIAEISSLSLGVTLRQGNTVRSGQAAPTRNDNDEVKDPRKLTFQQYTEYLDSLAEGERQQQQLSANLRDPTPEPTPRQEVEPKESPAKPEESPAQVYDQDQDPDEDEEEEIEKYVDMGDLLDDEPVRKSPMAVRSDPDADLLRTVVPARVAKNIQFNTTLKNDPSWGVNPTRTHRSRVNPLPQRESTKQKTRVRKGRPILRPQKPVPRGLGFAGKQKLQLKLQPRAPAPIYPAKRGHGFTSGYLGEQEDAMFPSLKETPKKFSFNTTKKSNKVTHAAARTLMF